jgi:phenylalanyl-tRNA synthetase alpha chain
MAIRNAYSNIPKSIEDKIGLSLHNQKNHPIEIIKNIIYGYFDKLPNLKFDKFDDLLPYVSVEDNFDKLLIPIDHPARKKTDTYYVDEQTVLRTHTSAHQNELLQKGYRNFLVTGDVYRKDEIDKYHYPIFHQLEGVVQVPNDVNPEEFLLNLMTGLVMYLFPKNTKYRVNNDYFPFTTPSFELEVYYNDKWVEVLGCGVMHQDIVKNNNLNNNFVAFGLGLERYCLIAFEIPDIRYLWSTHDRFVDQFKSGKIVKFEPYSQLPVISKDISFWLTNSNDIILDDKTNEPINWTQENDFFEISREICSNSIEQIKLIDCFFHPKKELYSRTYKLTYSPCDPLLKDPAKFNSIVNAIQTNLGIKLAETLNLELR